MATSGSDDFVATRDEILKDALTNVGALGPNGTPTGKQYTHTSRLLNDLAKSIDADGQFLWRVVRASITTVASQANYTLGADLLDVDQPMRFTKSGETDGHILNRMTRDEYMHLTDRTEENRIPTLFYTEKDLASDGRVQMTVYFWPTPSTAGDSIEYAGFTRGEDFDVGSDNLDFPQSWIHCLKLGLSMMLAPAYGDRALGKYYRDLYEIEKSKLVNDDNERGDAFFYPYGAYGSYYGQGGDY